MATKKKALQAAAGAAGGDLLAIEDVFSTYLYTGNGSSQTITNGIDLAGEGGLVWIKPRVLSDRHLFVDTERGSDRVLASNNTNAEIIATNPSFQPIESFNSNGFTVGAFNDANDSGDPHASWTFRKAPRFFDCFTFTGDGVNGRVLNHNLGVEPGMVVVKSTSLSGADTGTWRTYHRGYGFGGGLSLERIDSAGYTFASPITAATDTTITLNNPASYGNINSNGATYVAYLFAHDPLGPSGDGSDGLIACGSVAGGATVDLGWEPQWIITKRTDNAGSWSMTDNMRGMPVGGGEPRLYAESNSAEDTPFNWLDINATGFTLNIASGSYIYIAIRRGPMRQPTSGTEVYSAGVVQNNTGRTLTNPLGYPSDMAFTHTSAGGDWIWQSRLTGTSGLFSNKTNAESTFYGYGFGNNTNYEADGTAAIGAYGWNFRRAPGFFDVVAYTGNGVAGRTVSHNLGVAPEMMIVKNRNGTEVWAIYHSATGNTVRLKFDDTTGNVRSTWNNTTPTDTVFTLGADSNSNDVNKTYIAYLFATLPGVSKVGSYTGNGSSQTVNCGFTSGARFILIKRTDSAGDWYVWDTARGIVAANDPHLSLNTTAAEVTTDDSVDPDNSGFIVNQVAATNINVSSASYIYLAVS